ncbi:hypothetical protein [Desulfosporosinus sp. SB140]|uniref:hypothetical protein n=1 Tax=Desulfosporosinus paludis TaxID=3115649 RepID=UPI00388E1C13
MQYLTAEQQPTQYYFQVWMDSAKTLAGSKTPDPNYVREYCWTLIPPEGQTATQYLANIKNEITLLVQAELASMANPVQSVTPLTGF